MRLGDTPVPIPNTMVKTQAADGTSLETVRESRWPPNLKKKNNTWDKTGFTSDLWIQKDLSLQMTDKNVSQIRTLKTAYWIEMIDYSIEYQDIRGHVIKWLIMWKTIQQIL